MYFSTAVLLAAGVASVSAQVWPYNVCGGLMWDYDWECESGYSCTASGTNAFPSYVCTPNNSPVIAHALPYGQCGGQGFTGPTLCPDGWTCETENAYFHNCFATDTVYGLPDPTPDLAKPGDFCASSATERGRPTDCVPGYTCSGPGVYGYYVCLKNSSLHTASTTSTTLVPTPPPVPTLSTSVVRSTSTVNLGTLTAS